MMYSGDECYGDEITSPVNDQFAGERSKKPTLGPVPLQLLVDDGEREYVQEQDAIAHGNHFAYYQHAHAWWPIIHVASGRTLWHAYSEATARAFIDAIEQGSDWSDFFKAIWDVDLATIKGRCWRQWVNEKRSTQ